MAGQKIEPAAALNPSLQVEALALEGLALQCGFSSHGKENLEKAPRRLESQESADGLVLKQSMHRKREDPHACMCVHVSLNVTLYTTGNRTSTLMRLILGKKARLGLADVGQPAVAVGRNKSMLAGSPRR